MTCLVVFVYSGLALWIEGGTSEYSVVIPAETKKNLASRQNNPQRKAEEGTQTKPHTPKLTPPK